MRGFVRITNEAGAVASVSPGAFKHTYEPRGWALVDDESPTPARKPSSRKPAKSGTSFDETRSTELDQEPPTDVALEPSKES